MNSPVDVKPIGEWDPVVFRLIAVRLSNTDKDASDATDAVREWVGVPGGCSPLVNGQCLRQVREPITDALEFFFALRQRPLGHVVGNVVQIAHSRVHAVDELYAGLQRYLDYGGQYMPVRWKDGQAVVHPHVGIPFRLALARLPYLFVSTR